MKKVAIYFGTFDPIHDLHIEIAELITQLICIDVIDELVFFPDKYVTDNYKANKTAFHHRQNMISNAIGENKKLKTTYSFEHGYLNDIQTELETSHALIEQIINHPKSKDKNFTFVFGADSYHKFRDEWTDGNKLIETFKNSKGPHKLIFLVNTVLLTSEQIVDISKETLKYDNLKFIPMSIPIERKTKHLSSTKIREVLKTPDITKVDFDFLINNMKQTNVLYVLSNKLYTIPQDDFDIKTTNINGKPYTYVSENDMVCSLLYHEGKGVYVVKQERPSGFILEPAGGKMDKDESPLMAALREAKEELGLVQGVNVRDLGTFNLVPGLATALTNFYIFHIECNTTLKLAEQDLDEDEDVEVVFIPIKEFLTTTYLDIKMEFFKSKLKDFWNLSQEDIKYMDL